MKAILSAPPLPLGSFFRAARPAGEPAAAPLGSFFRRGSAPTPRPPGAKLGSFFRAASRRLGSFLRASSLSFPASGLGSFLLFASLLGAQSLEETELHQLTSLKRVYVDRLTGGETAAQMRDIIIASLESSKLFVLTENQEKADAILRGAAEDLVYNESHSSSDGVNTHLTAAIPRSGYGSRSGSAGVGFGENESEHSTERRHEAIAAVRLVNKDGDVIWSTTQESLGAKYRGASADVAEKITTKLKEDFDRARKLKQAP
jgi:hypothetical protein